MLRLLALGGRYPFVCSLELEYHVPPRVFKGVRRFSGGGTSLAASLRQQLAKYTVPGL